MTIRRAGIGIVKLGLAMTAVGLLTTTVGCEAGNRSSVTGKVTANGEPVDGGTIMFAPVGGGAKPAMVGVNANGTYDLSGDGVPVGKNNLSYQPPGPAYPEGFEPKPGDEATPSKWSGYNVSTPEIEIKPGAQTLDIELTKK